MEKTAELGWEVITLEIMPDHVHLFLSTDPGVAPNQVAHRLKGYTSHVLRREFPHLVRLPPPALTKVGNALSSAP